MPRVNNKEAKIPQHTEAFIHRVKYAEMLLLDNQLFLKSKHNKELVAQIMEEFQCSARQAARYIKVARVEAFKIGEKDHETKFIEIAQKLVYSYELAKKLNRPNSMIKASIELAKLYGLEITKPGENLNINVDYSKLNERQLRRLAAGEDIRAVLADTDNVDSNTDQG